jgi:hypothetical protein
MMKLAASATVGVLAIIFLVAIYLAAGLAAMIAWNLCMPSLFALPRATFANGVGLAILSSLMQVRFPAK